MAELWDKGGFVMPFLAVSLLLLWYSLGHRLVTLRRGFSGDLRHAVKTAKKGDMGGLVGEGIVAAAHVNPGSNYRGRLEEAVAPFHAEARAHANTVKSVSAVAPLAGLLGTVTGMIETFDSLGSMSMHVVGGGGIGAGVGEALVSTQMGLVVAVPGLLIGSLLARREEQIHSELDQSVELLLGEVA